MKTSEKKNMITCYIYDLMGSDPKEYYKYNEPVYTKIDGVYGYLSVSMFSVYFFWKDVDNIHFDDVSDRFRVEYIFSNEN